MVAEILFLIGTLEGGIVAIGGDTTGWAMHVEGQKGTTDVEGDDALLKKFEGKRVLVRAEKTTKEWVERGKQPLLKVMGIWEVDPNDKGLIIRGKAAFKVWVEAKEPYPDHYVGFLAEEKPEGKAPLLLYSQHFAMGSTNPHTFEIHLVALKGLKRFVLSGWEGPIGKSIPWDLLRLMKTSPEIAFEFQDGKWTKTTGGKSEAVSGTVDNLEIKVE